VDATIMEAPCSTKNARKERDPERPQTQKGHPWHFGRKAHLGVDAPSGLVHTLTGTAANVADIIQTPALLQGEEKQACADAGYLGVEQREEIAAAAPGVEWHGAAKRGKVKAMAEGLLKGRTVQRERVKAQVRARVEPPFHILKNLFRHRKTRYRGLARNTAQLPSLFARANRFLVRRLLLSNAGI
jgi:transposase, IS5 family